jgi:hypothetical protein
VFTIIASRTGSILFVTDDEEEANREFIALEQEDGIPVHFL